MIEALTETSELFITGLLMCLFGLFLWNFEKLYSREMKYRDLYTEVLEEEGENVRSEKIIMETAKIKRRVPIYGMVIFSCGIILVGISFL